MKSNHKLRVFGAATLMFVIGASATVLAQVTPNDQKPGQHRMERREKIKQGLKNVNLTPEQKAKITAMHEQFKTNNAAAIAQMKALREQFKQARQDGATKEQLKALREKMKEQGQGLRTQRQAMREQIKAMLTPEQLEKLKHLRHGGPGRGPGTKDGAPTDVN